ncbi:Hypothetical protein CINCED_3A004092 [Cinara cedri]|uniref:Uncharacterized protein n=1 Tax=Cinara cedri TaxID=506608 RepID=A0A5E4NEE3_9HEMI|nr:Hypothetical protein CINCED_3A004092 [Cinara cedri]
MRRRSNVFDADMVRPFSASTIVCVYTELRSPTVTSQPMCATRPDRAHSASVSPRGRDNSNGDTECGDGRNGLSRRRRQHRKKVFFMVGNYPVDDDLTAALQFPDRRPIDVPVSRDFNTEENHTSSAVR